MDHSFTCQSHGIWCLGTPIRPKCLFHCGAIPRAYLYFGEIHVVISRCLYFGLPNVFFHVLYFYWLCLFITLILTAHWRLDFIEDMVGVSALRSDGSPFALRELHYLILYPLDRVFGAFSSLRSSTMSGSLLRPSMTCRRALVSDRTIGCV